MEDLLSYEAFCEEILEDLPKFVEVISEEQTVSEELYKKLMSWGAANASTD